MSFPIIVSIFTQEIIRFELVTTVVKETVRNKVAIKGILLSTCRLKEFYQYSEFKTKNCQFTITTTKEHLSLHSCHFVKMMFHQMTFQQVIFYQMTHCQMTFRQIVLHQNNVIKCFSLNDISSNNITSNDITSNKVS